MKRSAFAMTPSRVWHPLHTQDPWLKYSQYPSGCQAYTTGTHRTLCLAELDALYDCAAILGRKTDTGGEVAANSNNP